MPYGMADGMYSMEILASLRCPPTLLFSIYFMRRQKLLFYPLNYGVFGTRSRGKLMPLGAGLAILEAEL
jgi:hypothetical protein